MTSEVAILNKGAVALAADSAVTIQTGEGQKIYNTANKLFALSKYYPVGIMIYGNAEFMGIPWETIIKIYREKLKKQKFDTLGEYAQHFIDFLIVDNPLFPEDHQKVYFYEVILSYFNLLNEEINTEVLSVIEEHGEITESQVSEIVTNIVRDHYDEWDNIKNLSHIPEGFLRDTIKKYSCEINRAKKQIFEKLPISASDTKKLQKLCGYLFMKDRFPEQISGLAITGFGQKQAFPSLISFIIEAIVNGSLKYKRDRESEINLEKTATVVPFAQSQMVATFIEGIDPYYRNVIEVFLSRLFTEYPKIIVEEISQLEDEEKQKLVEGLKGATSQVLEQFKEEIQNYSSENHINPIINAVAVLPKDELAEMAESLVNLTSFRQKVSMDAETVGGPIDVAVISKGDGFIWIKRKHYFKSELNQAFFANYYRECEGVDGNE